MPAKTKNAKTFSFTFTVVGLRFRMKRDVRRALAGTIENAKENKQRGVNVKLVREQENRFHGNAVRVVHDGVGELRGKHLGYIMAEVADEIAPLMDDNLLRFKSAALVSLNPTNDWQTGQVEATFRDLRR